ncbi:dynein axonemal intermediate chain 2 isoform X4 [Leptopilina heterotoma]|uniref:dynein axonemal intermediate chain 2 isoform X4 n=1 Tax=Leptopilina heterotoma TaxID=63436 RepID=UPI001CA9D6E8|nr:dynein axonemal intermediate chain 2 isoform X4 [Leptopilina heterotoma]
MDVQYCYEKKRCQFGKRCNFSEQDKLEVDIKSDASQAQNFIRMDPITQGTQDRKIFAVHEINTTTATFKENGMHHVEGGWPKDINMHDLEQTVRYRRKIEKDEFYVHTMLQMLPTMEHCALQNNACNIYEEYFNNSDSTPLIQKPFSRTVNVYRDPLPMKRPITHLSWSPDQGNRIAVSYCNMTFKKTSTYSAMSYIWDVENPNKPCMELKPFSPMVTLEYNPKDSNILISGLVTGQIAVWDIRRASEPTDVSLIENSHRDPCHKVLWINSKTATEFFSASKDGQVKWWDTRKLQSPIETLVMDLIKPEEQNIDRAIGISNLQFEPSLGTRFMCGLENGIVISGNRKGKTPLEKIATRFKAHYGPVISVERNPTFVKNFLTVGDWTARIWSEDCRESCIVWTPGHRDLLTGGVWSTTRFSVFFITKVDGTLDVWDLIVQQDSPVLSVKVCDNSLTSIRPHEQGQLVAVASKNGMTYLIEFSEVLTTNQKNDKLLLTALLDRETRREKVIEAKNREQRLKMKTIKPELPSESHEVNKSEIQESNKDSHIVQCEQDYETAIQAEIARQSAEVNNNHLPNGPTNN